VYFASAQKRVTELNSVTNDSKLCGAWEAERLRLGVGTTGQHLWGLTNGVALFQKAFPQNIRLCVAQERSAALFGGPGTAFAAFPLL